MNNLESLPANLGYILLVTVALWVLYKLAVHTGESSPLLEDEPAPFTADATHIKGILAEVESLRRPLKSYKNMEHAAQYKAHVLAREYPEPDDQMTRSAADPYVPHVVDVRMP